MKRRRWEYKKIDLYSEDTVYILNGWGNEGWELVTATYDTHLGRYVLFLKREYE